MKYDDADLSKLLWDAREIASMYGDVVQGMTGSTDNWIADTVERIDAYRASRGWSPSGYGGESPPKPRPHDHEKWQLQQDPDGRTFCAACGEMVT